MSSSCEGCGDSGVGTERRGVEGRDGARRACGSQDAGGEARAPLAASGPADAEDVERRRSREHVRRRARASCDTCGQRQPSGWSTGDDEDDDREQQPERAGHGNCHVTRRSAAAAQVAEVARDGATAGALVEILLGVVRDRGRHRTVWCCGRRRHERARAVHRQQSGNDRGCEERAQGSDPDQACHPGARRCDCRSSHGTTIASRGRHVPGQTSLSPPAGAVARCQRQTRPDPAGVGPRIVELRGLEPLTPCMPCRCATSCATAPGPAASPGGRRSSGPASAGLRNLRPILARSRNRVRPPSARPDSRARRCAR